MPFIPKNASVLDSLSFRNLNLTGKLFNLSLHQIHILIISLLDFSKCTIGLGLLFFVFFALVCGAYASALDVTLGVAFGVALGVTLDVTLGVTLGVTLSITFV